MKKILIVDDESLIRHSLSAALRQDDIYVKAVPCGSDALIAIDAISFHLCFLDVNLPDINGLDLMKTIKRSSPATKIIIMTAGVVDEPESVRFIQANANLLLAKPFDLDSVKLFVDRIFGQGTAENRLTDDERTYERKEVLNYVICSVADADRGEGEKLFFAGILETSDAGMCIRTNYLLKPGQIIKFKDNPVLRTGIVGWSKNGGEGVSYHAGIKFVMPDGPPHYSLEQACGSAESVSPIRISSPGSEECHS